jgi:hypothetical protein
VARDRAICPAEQDEQAPAAGLVPGIRVGLGRLHANLARLGALTDVLELGDAIEDVAVQTRQVIGGSRGSFDRDRFWGWGRPRFHQA